jgi:hypothetical protein
MHDAFQMNSSHGRDNLPVYFQVWLARPSNSIVDHQGSAMADRSNYRDVHMELNVAFHVSWKSLVISKSVLTPELKPLNILYSILFLNILCVNSQWKHSGAVKVCWSHDRDIMGSIPGRVATSFLSTGQYKPKWALCSCSMNPQKDFCGETG